MAREKHFFPKGAFPAESIPPLVRRPRATRQRHRSAEAHAQLASRASVMAAVTQAPGSRVLEKCGLEQILEALKLLLSPGGERTEFGAGLHLGPLGRVCPASFYP